jgi:hypothetical protein
MKVNDELQVQNIYHDKYQKLLNIYDLVNNDTYANLKFNQIIAKTNYTDKIDIIKLQKHKLENFSLITFDSDKNYLKVNCTTIINSNKLNSLQFYFLDNDNMIIGRLIFKNKKVINMNENIVLATLEGYLNTEYQGRINEINLYIDNTRF